MCTESLSPSAQADGLTFIEQLQIFAEKVCQSPNVPYLTGLHSDGKTAIATRGACGTWSCPTCAARNAKRWVARILDGMNNTYTDASWHLLTLTAHEHWRTPERSIANIRSGWKKFYNRARYRWGKIPYARVWEPHANNAFHMHAIIASSLEWPSKAGKRVRTKDVARACGMGYQADVRVIENPGQAAGYVAKYLAKHLNEPHLYPDGARRVEVSRGWPKLESVEKEYEWIVHQTRDGQNRTLARDPALSGRRVIDLRPSVADVEKAIDLYI